MAIYSESPDSGAEEYSSPAQSVSPARRRKRPRSPSSSSSSPTRTWPALAEPISLPDAPAPENAAREYEAPVRAPAKKKFKRPSFAAHIPPAPAKSVPALPSKPAGLAPKTKPAAAAPTAFGRQLPSERSSRDLDPTLVLSSLLGKPKRVSGINITPEQRREWDQRKAADRAAREAEYAAQGPPIRMQNQMQTILRFEKKLKAKRTNISPGIVAAAFKQR